jgi:hypothetical protein
MNDGALVASIVRRSTLRGLWQTGCPLTRFSCRFQGFGCAAISFAVQPHRVI